MALVEWELTIMELVLIIDVDQMGNNYNTVAVKGMWTQY